MKIYTTSKCREALRQKFGTSGVTISVALNFKSNSVLARKIRCYTVNHLQAYIDK